MSVKLMSMVWDSSIPAPERFTVLALADAADDDGKCWPAVASIAKKVGASERTVQRHLSTLEAQSLLGKTVRANQTSIYRIDVRRLGELKRPPEAGCQSDTPRQSVTPCRGDDLSPGDTDVTRGGDTGVTQPVREPSKEDVGGATAPSDASSDRSDVKALCERLRDRMVENRCKPPKIGKAWHEAARLLLDNDHRDFDEAIRLIDWAQNHSFWRSNIKSTSKFRDQYDTLRQQAEETAAWRLSAPPDLFNQDDINPDEILGYERQPHFYAPEDLETGSVGWQRWMQNAREQWLEQRRERARAVIQEKRGRRA